MKIIVCWISVTIVTEGNTQKDCIVILNHWGRQRKTLELTPNATFIRSGRLDEVKFNVLQSKQQRRILLWAERI